MERLTDETQIGPFAALKDKAEAVPGAFGTYDCLYAHMVAVTRLKQYEDAMSLERAQELAQAEKDGRLVVLPCKAGSTVYAITSPANIDGLESEKDIDIFECTVESVTFYSNGSAKFRLYYHKVFVASFITVDDFGKIVFLTREEAEAALKKREEAAQ